MGIFEPIFTWGRHLPPGQLYLFIFAWLFVESTGFPISDEPLLLLAGFLTITHRLELLPVVIVALVGKVAASSLAYWIGMHFHLQRIARPAQQPQAGLGKWLYYIRPTPAAVTSVEDRFRKQGAWGVFFGRLIPVVRSFISYPAGAARMRFSVFLAATTAGSLLWIVSWTALGAFAGKSASLITGPASATLFGVAVVALIGAWLWNHRRQELAAHNAYHDAQSAATPTTRTQAAKTTASGTIPEPSNSTMKRSPTTQSARSSATARTRRGTGR